MTDDKAMDTQALAPGPEVEASPPSGPPPPFVRSLSERTIAGVAAAIGRRLGIGTGWVQFGFIVATIFGGLGIALYAAGWLLIPEEGQRQSVAQHLLNQATTRGNWFGLIALAIGAAILINATSWLPASFAWAVVFITVGFLLYRGDIDLTPSDPTPPTGPPTSSGAVDVYDADAPGGGDTVPPPPVHYEPAAPPPPGPPPVPPDPSHLGRFTIAAALLAVGVIALVGNVTNFNPYLRHYVAAVVVAVGAGLVIGGWFGRARWMILLGVFLIPALFSSPAAEVDWAATDGYIQPETLAALSPNYDFPIGGQTIDLTLIEWDGETIPLDVELGAGSLRVLVPNGVAVTGSVDVGIGRIETPSFTAVGAGLDEPLVRAGDDGTLELSVDVGAGEFVLSVFEDDFNEMFEGFEESGQFGGASGTYILQPTTVDDLFDSPYIDLGSGLSGDVTLDLTQLDLTPSDDFGDEVFLDIYLISGDIEVLVPPNIDISVTANALNGTANVFGTTGNELSLVRDTGASSNLQLSVMTDFGNITVTESTGTTQTTTNAPDTTDTTS